MGLEVAPFVQDFVSSNPISGDDVNQGDDHIRMMKATLKATFPTATKAIYASTVSAKTATFSVLASDENRSFTVDCTAGAVVATLPALVSGDHGWSCFFIKLDAVNTFHIAPASGTVSSGPYTVARARRCIPGVLFGVYWSGSNWYIERCERNPIGSLVPYTLSALPAGYEWPNGQTLTSLTTHPEYFAAKGSGVTADLRGRGTFGKSDMGGSDNGLLSTVPGTTLLGTGGAQTLAITQANLPSVSFTNSGIAFTGTLGTTQGNVATGYSLEHSHSYSAPATANTWFAGTGTVTSSSTGATTGGSGTLDHAHYFTPAGTMTQGSAASGGSGTAYNKLPPIMVLNFLLVVE